ncbi:flagellar basal body rod protein FlgF [Thiomicrorhabdus sp. ZW0627]|uniref:flagellar basal body rod protein FlgF n=1 Tax=Thiomicrorhabdus sp. ZW0627 TaxID=3039774 RepID=UPI0024362E73|nr:flagellar basal body rod protein FlgF [Thiomicrorhabdus sp. ZW0627]MDG6773374.1 flagellar basal body rod protein FlgF [Thiomicrorhabdus sp. ZW0627]
MDRMLYISMSGAKEVMLSQANNANNLANANTDGFKQDFNEFRAQHVQGPGWQSRTYSLDERPATDFTPGAVKVTGRELDVMTKENGFLAIQTPEGEEAYTRTASMQVTANGDLVDVKGNPILNTGGVPINIPPSKSITIGDDGTISIVPAGSPSNQLVVLDQLRLVEPDLKSLEKGEDGYIRQIPGAGELIQGNVKVVSGALEGSNVNTAEALVNMIELSRKYEMQVKMMSIAKTHAQKSDQILSLS